LANGNVTIAPLRQMTSDGSTSSATAKTLFDYFLPVPIVDKVAQAPWGASNVQPRDQDNGLEDKTMKSYYLWTRQVHHLMGFEERRGGVGLRRLMRLFAMDVVASMSGALFCCIASASAWPST